MFDTAASVEAGATLSFDVCIAGAGAAGITLALELAAKGLTVGLFEAGGFEPATIDGDHPYHGSNVGRPYSLTSSRLRYLGGSTNHWGGWCRPLDSIDFEARSFIPWSGWPISRRDLDPFYRRAAQWCEIEPAEFELTEMLSGTPIEPGFLDPYDPHLTTKNFRLSPPTRFGQRYRQDIEQHEGIRCFLDCTVVEIERRTALVERPDREVGRFRVRSGEKELFVTARAFVLALGGIENPRLLLHSNRDAPAGIGNEHGWVGRCFADHFGLTVGSVLTTAQAPYRQHSWRGVEVIPHLSFTDEYLLDNELVNFGALLLPSQSEEKIGAGYLDDVDLYDPPPVLREQRLFSLLVRIESTPNPESRVTLAPELDSNGMRRVRLDWRVNSLEIESLERTVEILARRLGASGLGRLRRSFFDIPLELRDATYGAHHLGTTRMSSRPEAGVVDASCRVHSVPNLYIAGSSVFPAFGFANPTLTILALTVRLAGELESGLR